MTTRITLAILLTTWIILIIGETAAFLTARQSLLATAGRHDHQPRAPQTLEIIAGSPARQRRRESCRGTASRFATRAAPIAPPASAAATGASPVARGPAETDDLRVTQRRTIKIRVPVERGGRPASITVAYSRPTEAFDWLLSYLAGMLLLISLACGLTTAWLALKLSRAALRPLRETADVIAEIDERKLWHAHRRRRRCRSS